MNFQFCPICGSALTESTEKDSTRTVCSDDGCRFVYYDNPTPVVAAIVQWDQSVVLIQNRGWPDHWYGLVSGFLEKNETPEEAIKREVLEEIEVEARNVSWVGNYAFDAMNQIILAYHLSIDQEPKIGPELADLKVVEIEKLIPWDFGTGQAVKEWLAKRT